MKKAPVRTLRTIVNEIRGTLRNDVTSIIKRGQLLLEAKEQVEHGGWLPWLNENFDMGERSAQRAMLVAEFVVKYDRLTDLNLTKGALYALASGEYPENVIDAVINRSAPELITETVLDDVNELLNEVLNAEPEAEESGGDNEDDQEEEEQSEDEAEAILDGPPPELPPTAEPPAPTDFTLVQFDNAVKMLAELHTKSVSKFVGTDHSADDLKKIADFLSAVAVALNGKTLRRTGNDSWELVGGLQ